jgi:hypothetical protein
MYTISIIGGQEFVYTISMKKKMGRPKLAKGDAKSVLYCARFTPEEAKGINAAVKRSGMERSDWMRLALLQASK